jgi:putative endonuclease
MPATRPWFVYLIECRNGTLYTGISPDVAARYAAHAAGRGARYTRANPPLRLLGCIACSDRAAAGRAEYRIRRLRPAAKRALFAADPPTR